jgi:hypothetical protein
MHRGETGRYEVTTAGGSGSARSSLNEGTEMP